MNVSLVTITNVAIRINEQNQIFAHINFANPYVACEHDFLLTRISELKRIEALMRYTNTPEDFMFLTGKTVRIITDNFLRFIGSATEDKFFPVASQEFTELTMNKLNNY